MSTILSVFTFGSFGARGLAARPKGRNASALIAYLTVTGERAVSREILTEILWGGKSIKRARHSLSQLLYEVRRCVPPGVLRSTVDSVWIDTTRVRSDYEEFRSSIDEGDFERAIELYKGRFLDGFRYVTDAFDDWRLEVDARTHRDAVGAFNALVSEALDREDYSRAAALAKAALIFSPLDSNLVKARIEALAAGGDVARALRELELARNQLRVESGSVSSEILDELGANLARLASPSPVPARGNIHVKLVGRTEILQEVRMHWRQASRTVCAVGLSGEPGIGKSRILEHIVRRSVLDGDRAFLCRCSAAESRLPYGTIASLIRSTFRPLDLERLEGHWSPIIASIAPELFPGLAPAHGCSQRALWEAITHYFAAAAELQPLVIGVDDLHWADEISKEVIRYVLKRLSDHRVLFVAAFRGSIELPVFEIDKPDVLSIRVGELAPSCAAELIQTAAEQHNAEIDSADRDLLVKRLGGRPFFLLEAVRQLSASLSANRMETLEVSPTLERHLDSRLCDLDSTSQRVLDAVAVLSRPTTLQFLVRVTGLSAVHVASTADSLIDQGILSDTGEIGLSHDLLLEAQRRRMRESDRRLWHSRIADVLAAAPDSHAGEIAAHYEKANELDKAQQFAGIAKDEALALHAHAEADVQYHRMIRCSSGSGKIEAEVEYIKWLARCARLKDIAPFAASLGPILQNSSDHEALLALALGQYDQLERDVSPSAQLKAEATKVVEYADKHAPHLLTAVLWQVADTLRRNGDFDMIANLAGLIRFRSEGQVPAQSVEMLSVSALLTALSAGHRAALPTAERAVSQSDSIGDAFLIAKALYTRGTINLLAGRIESANQDYRRLTALADPIGPDDLLERMRSNRSIVLMEQGELDAADLSATTALMEMPAVRRGYSYGNLCLIALRRGDIDAAFRYANALSDWNSVAQNSWIPVHAQALLGIIELAVGAWDKAAERARFVRQSLHTGGIGDMSHAYLLVARVDAADGNVLRALEFLSGAARKTRKLDRLAGARLDLERARLYARLGRHNRSRVVADAVRSFAATNGAVLLMHEADMLIAEDASAHPRSDIAPGERAIIRAGPAI